MPRGLGGGRLSFEDEYGRLWPYAYRVGYRYFGSPPLAEDVAQETLTRAYERWPRVSRHPNPEGWVVKTADNVSMSVLKKRSHTAAYDVPEAVHVDDLPFEHPELVEALRRLSERQRLAVVARYMFDLDVRDAAALLGWSESKITTASDEARANLRQNLGISVEVL